MVEIFKIMKDETKMKEIFKQTKIRKHVLEAKIV